MIFGQFTIFLVKKVDAYQMKKDDSEERVSCEDVAMGRENIKIPVMSKHGTRPPKLIYPRTEYWVPKYVSDEEFKGNKAMFNRCQFSRTQKLAKEIHGGRLKAVAHGRL